MSIEWLKQYLLWGLFFFVATVVLTLVYAGVKYIIKTIKKRLHDKD